MRFTASETPVKLYCCYSVITVLTIAVIVLATALSGELPPFSVECQHPSRYWYIQRTLILPANRGGTVIVNKFSGCPANWIGVNESCFYFSEYASNWTFSQTLCRGMRADLARFNNQEELVRI